MKEKLGRHKRPKNVKHGKEVKVNTEIYRRLKKYTKIRDIKLKRLHKICLKTAFAGARLAESCRKMQEDSEPVAVKAWGKALYNNTTDVISFAGQVSYGLNMLRVSSKNFYQQSCNFCYNLEDLNSKNYVVQRILNRMMQMFNVSAKRKHKIKLKHEQNEIIMYSNNL